MYNARLARQLVFDAEITPSCVDVAHDIQNNKTEKCPHASMHEGIEEY